jgi:ATP-dependent DNA helicase RecQ
MELLKQMTFYAASTRCLRSRLLEYFGEEPSGPCNNCSVCNRATDITDVTLDARKIVSCVYRVAQARKQCGKALVVDILQGKNNERIRKFGFESLSTYGIMADSDAERIRLVMEYLIQHDYLYIEGSQYPLLRLGPHYKEVFIQDYSLELPLPRVESHEARLDYAGGGSGRKRAGASGSAKKSALTGRPAPIEAEDAAPLDEGLFAELKKLRSKLATEAGMPAYIVFADAALRDMCRKKPVTASQFLAVAGVGERKLERYGAAFMETIRSYGE